ncbi:MAG: hypothetical protein H0T12_05965 [Actinobacteria bacterium]|nr:hypothetical protein [Actinomycetota bacterium]
MLSVAAFIIAFGAPPVVADLAPFGAQAHDYVHERGGRGVFFGSFVGVLRALVPAIAGTARLP